MIASIHQPQYLPWAGYLDKVDQADVFILLDTVQFKKGEWQNRNRLKTATGPAWVTVPVLHDFGQFLADVVIDPAQHSWNRKHQQALRTHYGSTPHFTWVADRLDQVWQQEWERLAPLNRATLDVFMALLGIDTPLLWASEMDPTPEHPDERLISLCRQIGADTYLAGSAGPDYMEMEKWQSSGIEVCIHDFAHPVYNQPFGDFLPAMSAADLLCNCGPDSLTLMREANNR
ncbi:WbqC family protein [Candidatus Zixiibacteriota bacterium]